MIDNLMTTAGRSVDILDKNKDKLLLVGGLITGLGTVIMASRGTLKAKDILEEYKQNKKDIQEAVEEAPGYELSKTHKNDVIVNKVGTGANIVKAYVPAAVLGAASVACIIGEHQVMQSKVNSLEKTVASLGAAYVAVDTAFKAYRNRVKKKYGEEEDYKLRYDIQEESVEYTDEKGKTKKKKVETVGDLDISDYSKFFDATCASFIFQDPMQYKPDWHANISFLKGVESWANKKLGIDGYLFLNEVYDELGIPLTDAGQSVGWIVDEDDPKNMRRKVSFGVYDICNRRVINGLDDECILLDFNVDGPIIGKTRLAAK